ncbi:EscU/YscU/HrcU family type III secretion system export apparatus switch protein [Kordiimonas sp.]|uniref:EscU/YscU/HrcU family type III secretion system export apparatus switch protein n=1 Tax=Kordiimonas sp. TaxID=1970157 RepID=UPI003A9578B0
MSNQDPDKVPDTKAVAIKRDGEGSAPNIAAKGHGHLAEKILDIAFAEGVKVRQDKDLVELLDAFDVDCPVPLEALHAVSLILERVYAENRRMEGAGAAKAGTVPPQGTVSIDAPVAERIPPQEGE